MASQPDLPQAPALFSAIAGAPVTGAKKSRLPLVIAAVIVVAALAVGGFLAHSLWKARHQQQTATAPPAAAAPQPVAPAPATPAPESAPPVPAASTGPAPQSQPTPKKSKPAPAPTSPQQVSQPQQTPQSQKTSPPPPPAATPPPASEGKPTAAVVVKTVLPKYPLLAKMAGISGPVKVHVVIAKDGTVKTATAVSGHKLLQKAACDAIAQWIFKPVTLNGKPTEVETDVTVNFNLGQQ